jgi:hypothetical protein
VPATVVPRSSKRPPLVYVSQAAAAEARRLLGSGRVVENEIAEVVAAGRAVRDRDAGPGMWVIRGHGWVARARRRRSPLGTHRAAFSVQSIEVQRS